MLFSFFLSLLADLLCRCLVAPVLLRGLAHGIQTVCFIPALYERWGSVVIITELSQL